MTEQSGAAAYESQGVSPLTESDKRKHSPEEIVNRLQSRIVKAQEAGKWNKVKALQHLLTRSRSARILAVERVSENDGKRTPGVDGET